LFYFRSPLQLECGQMNSVAATFGNRAGIRNPAAAVSPAQRGEARHEHNSDLRARINGSPGRRANNRATTGASESPPEDSLNRPGLDQIRDRARRTVLNRVMITSPDRLARNFVQQMVLIEELERAGCSVEFSCCCVAANLRCFPVRLALCSPDKQSLSMRAWQPEMGYWY
jgi:hypothetical protein